MKQQRLARHHGPKQMVRDQILSLRRLRNRSATSTNPAVHVSGPRAPGDVLGAGDGVEVAQRCGVVDAGEEHLRSVSAEHGVGERAVAVLDLRERLPARHVVGAEGSDRRHFRREPAEFELAGLVDEEQHRLRQLPPSDVPRVNRVLQLGEQPTEHRRQPLELGLRRSEIERVGRLLVT